MTIFVRNASTDIEKKKKMSQMSDGKKKRFEFADRVEYRTNPCRRVRNKEFGI